MYLVRMLEILCWLLLCMYWKIGGYVSNLRTFSTQNYLYWFISRYRILFAINYFQNVDERHSSRLMDFFLLNKGIDLTFGTRFKYNRTVLTSRFNYAGCLEICGKTWKEVISLEKVRGKCRITFLRLFGFGKVIM